MMKVRDAVFPELSARRAGKIWIFHIWNIHDQAKVFNHLVALPSSFVKWICIGLKREMRNCKKKLKLFSLFPFPVFFSFEHIQIQRESRLPHSIWPNSRSQNAREVSALSACRCDRRPHPQWIPSHWNCRLSKIHQSSCCIAATLSSPRSTDPAELPPLCCTICLTDARSIHCGTST